MNPIWQKQRRIFNLNQNPYTVSHAQCPTAIEIRHNIYRIYFSSRDSLNRSLPISVDFDIANQLVVQVQNKPFLDLGGPGTFDESGVMPQHAFKHQDKIYLYYTGWHLRNVTPFETAIGLAISEDNGETFEKVSKGPVLGSSLSDPFFVGGNTVIVDNDKFKMWYLSCTDWKPVKNNYEPVYLIKYAESDDGVHWSPHNRVCIDYRYDGEAIARPFVLKDRNLYKMWYSPRHYQNFRGSLSVENYRIGYAESRDGTEWVRMDEKVGISPSKQGWDSEMIAYASIVKAGDTMYMFYNGNGFGREGFGIARLISQ